MKSLPYVDDYEFFRVNDITGAGPGIIADNPRLPMTPWVLIQFRTAVYKTPMEHTEYMKKRAEGLKYDIDKDSEWTTVSFRAANESITDDLYADINASKSDANVSGGSLKFDNYFENLDIEDNGGFLKCSMRLYDKDFSRLESIIMRSMVAMKAGNKIFDSSGQTTEYMLQFSAGGAQSINFRVRYGYADESTSGTNIEFIDETSEEIDAWKNRAKMSGGKVIPKMVLKTPWFYFQMMSCKFLISDGGLSASIEGISMGNSIFQRMKILQRFCGLEGTPKSLIEALGRTFFVASNGIIQFVNDKGETIAAAGDEPSSLKQVDADFKTEWGKTWVTQDTTAMTRQYGAVGSALRTEADKLERNMLRIQVMMGSEPRKPVDKYGVTDESAPWIQEFDNIKTIIDKVCSQVPSIYSYETAEEIKLVTDELIIQKIRDGKEETITIDSVRYNRNIFKPIPYTYSVKEKIVGDKQKIVIVRFFYKTETVKDQAYVRRYKWRNNPHNILNVFAVSSDFDFAQMNQTIVTRTASGIKASTTAPSTAATTEPASGATISVNEQLLNSLSNQRGFLLVSNIVDTNAAEEISVAQGMIDNMNNQSFKGTIELPGDPFYMFGGDIQPYQYGIYVDVVRDRNLYWDGIDNGSQQIIQKSYLSGFYLISSIRHMFSASGYKTNLTVMKWPTNTTKLIKRT